MTARSTPKRAAPPKRTPAKRTVATPAAKKPSPAKRTAAKPARTGPAARRPLAGKLVLITRPRAQAAPMRDALTGLGAEVLEAPVFRIVPPRDSTPLRRAAARLSSYDWIFLTSANGVETLFDVLVQLGRDAQAFGKAKVAAIGPGTAGALERRGVHADVVPRRFVAEGILEAFAGVDLAGRKALVWRAAGAREVLPEGLRASGAVVEQVEAYRLADEPIEAQVVDRVDAGSVSAVIFTSASTVRGLRKALGAARFRKLSREAVLAAIGPVTAAELRRLDVPVGVEAAEHTVQGVVRALVACFADGKD
jgi:uroporphyrinogen III methyltransferase/synthase